MSKCCRLNLVRGSLNVEPCNRDAIHTRELFMALSLGMNTGYAYYNLSMCEEHTQEFDSSPGSAAGYRTDRPS